MNRLSFGPDTKLLDVVQALCVALKQGTMAFRLETAFRVLDRQNTETVTLKEFQLALLYFKVEISDRLVRDIFDLFTTDSRGRLKYMDFLRTMSKLGRSPAFLSSAPSSVVGSPATSPQTKPLSSSAGPEPSSSSFVLSAAASPSSSPSPLPAASSSPSPLSRPQLPAAAVLRSLCARVCASSDSESNVNSLGEKLAYCLMRCDRDQDGMITLPEFSVALSSAGIVVHPRMVAQLFELFDMESEGRISVEAFLTIIHHQNMHQKEIARLEAKVRNGEPLDDDDELDDEEEENDSERSETDGLTSGVDDSESEPPSDNELVGNGLGYESKRPSSSSRPLSRSSSASSLASSIISASSAASQSSSSSSSMRISSVPQIGVQLPENLTLAQTVAVASICAKDNMQWLRSVFHAFDVDESGLLSIRQFVAAMQALGFRFSLVSDGVIHRLFNFFNLKGRGLDYDELISVMTSAIDKESTATKTSQVEPTSSSSPSVLFSPSSSASSSYPSSSPSGSSTSESWQRIALDDGLELHVRQDVANKLGRSAESRLRLSPDQLLQVRTALVRMMSESPSFEA